MTSAERSIKRAETASRQIEGKYPGFALVWMGERRGVVEKFIAVKDGEEKNIIAYCDNKGNVKLLEEMPRF